MNYITLATRAAKWYNPIDSFLSAMLRSKYIHSELIFDNNYKSFSSRGRIKGIVPKKKGVSFAQVEYGRGDWIYTKIGEVKMPEHESMVLSRCNEIKGKKYDMPGAMFNAGFRLPIDKADRFWCSEACAYALQDFYKVLGRSDNVTPGKLLEIVRGW